MENTKQLVLTYYGVIYSKKNSKRIVTNRRTGRPMIVSSEKAKEMENDMVKQFSDQYHNTSPIDKPFAAIYGKPLKVKISIWQKDKTRRDLDNQATSILDALVAGGVIVDDSVDIVQELIVKMMGTDKKHPRARIEIRGVKDAE